MAGEALGRLCIGGGWTHAAFWRIDCGDPRLLVLVDSFHEEQSVKISAKMFNPVHVIGQGIIGEVAMSGKHRWINFDTSSSVNPDMFQSNIGWQDQILAGIKTVAIVPLPSFGIIQFGSTQKICESSDFIAQTLNLLQQFRIKQHAYVYTDFNFSHPQTTFPSMFPSLDFSRLKNSISSNDSFCKQRQGNNFSFECSMSVSTSCAYSDHDNLFYGTPCFNGISSPYQVINQEPALAKARISSTWNNSELHPNFKCANNFCSTSSKYHTRAKEIGTFSYMDHQLFPQMAIPEGINMIPTTHSSIPDVEAFNLLSENSVLSHSKGGSKAILNNSSESSSKFSPLTPDFPENFLTSPQDQNYDISIQSNPESTNHHILDKSMNNQIHSVDKARDWIESTSDVQNQFVSDHNDLFDDMELDLSKMILRHECWDDMVMPITSTSCTDLSNGVLNCMSEFAMCSVAGSGKEFFTDSSSLEQLLDAVVTGDTDLSASCNSVASQNSRKHVSTISELSNTQMTSVPFIAPSSLVSTSSVSQSKFNIEKVMQGSSKEAQALWIDDSCSVNDDGSAHHLPKKLEESGKVVRKRARPGESTRPKPKDRQQIQDRVKELREIVPNSAKCSIDALLDRTIKHMLFLQSVTKYADKVKQVDEPELIGEESGVVLKDNTNGGIGGTTWAYEVAGQTMVCPILVEDVHPSGQMIVEMLCEERGFFLEIADVVRGFGLTILKGVMEIRERKLWSRFLVEANRDVTRMDIFLSLVQLLHQASSFRPAEPHSKPTGIASLAAYQQQYPAPIPICLDDRLL